MGLPWRLPVYTASLVPPLVPQWPAKVCSLPVGAGGLRGRGLECSPWTKLASLRALHGCGRTGWVGGEGSRCSHLAFSPTALAGVGVGNKLEELKSPFGRK